MKKFIINEEEKNRIRGLYQHPLKNNELMTEQKWLKNLFGTSVDDLVKMFGDDAVRTFETVLSKALQNSRNFVARAGQNYLKSASGAEISMETIEKVTKLVSSGAKNADEVAQYLPSKLADGTEFRSVFQNSFKVKPKPVAPSANPKVTTPVNSNIPSKAEYRAQVSQVNSKYGAGSN
jgi:hypothetical protein